jgi:hypothetical protein
MQATPANSHRRRLIWSLAVFPFYVAAGFLGSTRAGGNPFELGVGYGLIIGVIFAPLTYCFLLMLQAALISILRWITRPRTTDFSLFEFIPVFAFCLLVLSSFLWTSDEDYYRRFVGKDVPRSLHDFESRHVSGFGSVTWAMHFRLDPAEFPKLTAGREFTRESSTALFPTLQADGALALSLPNEPAAWRYVYSHITSDSIHVMTIWTNTAHDVVYITGGQD